MNVTFNYKLLGYIIKAKRRDVGLRELGKKVGASPSLLSRLERGDVDNIQVDNLMKICCWLDIHPAAFFLPVLDKSQDVLGQFKQERLGELEAEIEAMRSEMEMLK